jgi:hypothetical protein
MENQADGVAGRQACRKGGNDAPARAKGGHKARPYAPPS